MSRPDSTAPVRVAFVAGTLGAGGAEKQLVFMIQSLRNAGVRAAVFSLGADTERYATRLRQLGVELWTASPRRRVVPRLVGLVRALRRFQPDIIQASHFYVGLYAVIAGWILQRPVVGALRNDLRTELEANPFWGRWLFRLPDALIANSQAAIRNATARGLDATKIRFVSNVVTVAPLEETASPSAVAAEPVITAMAVANLFPRKRLDRFLDVLARARVSCPALRGIIVGTGPLAKELAAGASARGLDRNALTFAGHTDDIRERLSSASVLCLTSSAEGTPNVILEAMAMARPVIAMDAGDVARLVEDGVTGFLVPQGDTESFAECLVTLANNPALRVTMGLAGRSRVERQFAAGQLAPQLLCVYRDLAASSRDRHLLARLEQIQVVN